MANRRGNAGAGGRSNTRLIVIAAVLGAVLVAVLVSITLSLSNDGDGGAAEPQPPVLVDGMRILTDARVGEAEYPDGWEITTVSGAAEMELAQHLSDSGARMYGAWWCPHCYNQKQLFGEQAFAVLKSGGVYVECQSAANTLTPECGPDVIEITGFPTWVVDGQVLPGVPTQLDALAQVSGYTGSTEFLYRVGSG